MAVEESDAQATVPLAFALASVPLGLPALAVSIRTVRLSTGVPFLRSASLIEDTDTPLPIISVDRMVRVAVSPSASSLCRIYAAGVMFIFSLAIILKS